MAPRKGQKGYRKFKRVQKQRRRADSLEKKQREARALLAGEFKLLHDEVERKSRQATSRMQQMADLQKQLDKHQEHSKAMKKRLREGEDSAKDHQDLCSRAEKTAVEALRAEAEASLRLERAQRRVDEWQTWWKKLPGHLKAKLTYPRAKRLPRDKAHNPLSRHSGDGFLDAHEW